MNKYIKFSIYEDGNFLRTEFILTIDPLYKDYKEHLDNYMKSLKINRGRNRKEYTYKILK